MGTKAVEKGEFPFAAAFVEHGHSYVQCQGFIEEVYKRQHQHLEKRYAAPIRGEAVANAACHCAAQAARLPLAIQPAGSAGNIVFRRVRQNAQLIHEHGGIWHAKDLLSTRIDHMFYSVL